MTEELTNFLLKEYQKAGISPKYIRLGGKNYLIPADYIIDFKDYTKAFISDFFFDMRADYNAYKKNGEPVQYITYKDEDKKIKLVVPYAWRHKNKTEAEIAAHIFARADKNYAQANACLYKKQELTVPKNNAYALAQKVVKTLKTAHKKTHNNSKWSTQNLRDAANKWFVRVALAVSLGGVGYMSLSQKNQSKETAPILQDSTIISKKQKIDTVFDHNKRVFEKNLDTFICVLAFVEDYRSKAYDDGMGVYTIGFGTTFYLNEKGEKTGKVRSKDQITSAEAIEQMRRYLNFIILPQIEKNVNVCIDDESMKTLVPLCYLLGNSKFRNSLFLETLNKGIQGQDLANTTSIYRRQNGVCKRLWLSLAVAKGHISVQDLLELPIASCYRLHKKDVFEHQKNKLRKGRNEQAFFKLDSQTVEKNISKMSKTHKKTKLKNVLPPEFVQKIEKPQSNKFLKLFKTRDYS